MSVGLQGPLKHGVRDLESKKFTFSALDNSTFYQGIPVKTINMTQSALTGQQGSLRLVIMVFLRAGSVTFGNETFKVQSGTMKFNIEVGPAIPSIPNFTRSENFGHENHNVLPTSNTSC